MTNKGQESLENKFNDEFEILEYYYNEFGCCGLYKSVCCGYYYLYVSNNKSDFYHQYHPETPINYMIKQYLIIAEFAGAITNAG